MKPLALIFTLLWTTALTLLPAASEEPKAQQLKCDIGPVKKTYGKTRWLVYSCDDSGAREPSEAFLLHVLTARGWVSA
jgi:hypothetical protein